MNQEQALEILKKGHNVFLTGSPGAGKTFLLNKFIDYLRTTPKVVATTASTGIAATHMNGVTIHSWSGLGYTRKHINKKFTVPAEMVNYFAEQRSAYLSSVSASAGVSNVTRRRNRR